MRRRSGYYIGVTALAVLAVVVNAFIFYFSNCSGEYVQSVDVWGRTQTESVAGLRRRELLLERLSDRSADEAIAEVQKIIEAMTPIIFVDDGRRTYRQNSTAVKAVNEETSEFVTTVGLTREDCTEVLEWLKAAYGYRDYVEGIARQADAIPQTSLFGDGWYVSNAILCGEDFEGLENYRIVPELDNTLNAVVNYRISDILMFITVIAAAVFTGLAVRRSDIYGSSGGGKPWGPVVFGLAAALVQTVSVYFSNIVMTDRWLTLFDRGDALQSFAAFRSCPYTMTVGLFLALEILGKFVFFAIVYALIVFALTGEGHGRIISRLAVLAVLTGTEYFLSVNSGGGSVREVLREWNIFSALSFERFFNRYQNLNIAGRAVSRLPMFSVMAASVLTISLILSFAGVTRCDRRALKKRQQEYYDDINAKYEETRRLWHDFNNHLMAIRGLIDSDRREEAGQYVSELQEEINRSHLIARTGCEPVDCLLVQKKQAAYAAHITLETEILCRIEGSRFAAYDLCCVIGNLIDNAVEAVEKLGNDGRVVRFTMKKQQGMLYISCENPFEGELKKQGTLYATQKQDAAHHGIGLRSVENVARKYNGRFEVQAENGIFRAQLILIE